MTEQPVPAPEPRGATVDAAPISEWIDLLAKARHAKKIAAEREEEARSAILSFLESRPRSSATPTRTWPPSTRPASRSPSWS